MWEVKSTVLEARSKTNLEGPKVGSLKIDCLPLI